MPDAFEFDEVGTVTLTPQDRAKFLAAGLPLPVYTRRNMSGTDPRSTAERLSYDAKVGTLVHQVIAQVCNEVRGVTLADRAALVNSVVVPLTRNRRDLGRGDKTAARVSSLVAQYLAHFLPSPEAHFLGAELSAGTGRTDLAWRLPGAGVWFDELKTWRGVGDVFDEATMRQVYTYLDHGKDLYGDEFVGVRVLPLGHTHAARLVKPTGAVVSLDGFEAVTDLEVSA